MSGIHVIKYRYEECAYSSRFREILRIFMRYIFIWYIGRNFIKNKVRSADGHEVFKVFEYLHTQVNNGIVLRKLRKPVYFGRMQMRNSKRSFLTSGLEVKKILCVIISFETMRGTNLLSFLREKNCGLLLSCLLSF